MWAIYRIDLNVRPSAAPGEDADVETGRDCAHWLWNQVRYWINQRYLKTEQLGRNRRRVLRQQLEIPQGKDVCERIHYPPPDGHRLHFRYGELEQDQVPGTRPGVGLMELSWRVPGFPTDLDTLLTKIHVGYDDEGAHFRLLFLLSREECADLYPDLDVPAPKLVASMLREGRKQEIRFDVNGEELPLGVTDVEDSAALWELLAADERRMPVVVVTPSEGQKDRSEHLFNELQGVCRVVRYRSPRTPAPKLLPSWADLACPQDSVRLVFPGIPPGSPGMDELLFERARIDGIGARGEKLHRTILQRIGWFTSLKADQYGKIGVALQGLARRRGYRVRLCRDYLVDQGETAREALAAIEEQPETSGEPEAEIPSQPPPKRPPQTTLAGFVQAMEAQQGSQLAVTSAALRTAEKRHAFDQKKLAVALIGLSELATRTAEGTWSGPWEEFFRLRRFSGTGIKYASTESKITMAQHGQHRRFVGLDGDSLRVEHHLTISKGTPQKTVQIYFDYDPRRTKMVVFHCGDHLPIARTSSRSLAKPR